MHSKKQQTYWFAGAGETKSLALHRTELYHRGGQAATGKVALLKCVAIRSEQL